MESIMSSDDSCDSEIKNMKNQLIAFGFEEDNLCKEEMSDLLKALNYSKTSMKEDELLKEVKDTATSNIVSPPKNMKRRYLNVRDRRMPWSLLPSTITPAEKARTLAVYIKLMSINNYRQARQSSIFATWPPPIQIVEKSTRVQPVRSTRSGRSVPIYTGLDDDSSDFDFLVTKTKKRKNSGSDHNAIDGVYSNKVVSLKRKPSKDENMRPIKEPKMYTEHNDLDSVSPENNVAANHLTIVED